MNEWPFRRQSRAVWLDVAGCWLLVAGCWACAGLRLERKVAAKPEERNQLSAILRRVDDQSDRSSARAIHLHEPGVGGIVVPTPRTPFGSRNLDTLCPSCSCSVQLRSSNRARARCLRRKTIRAPAPGTGKSRACPLGGRRNLAFVSVRGAGSERASRRCSGRTLSARQVRGQSRDLRDHLTRPGPC